MCYTRSSSITSKIFPDDYQRTDSFEEHSILSNHVYDPNKLKVYKFSTTMSQRHLEHELQKFLESPDLEVFLLVFGIHESSRKKQMYINHVRIIMEQIEIEHSKQDKTKLMVLLLLFPPASFAQACYPCIFLDGWAHYYLDSISQATLEESKLCKHISIRDWFRQFCLQNTSEVINLEPFLLSILDDAIPVLVSRLHFYDHRQMNGHKASEMIKNLLNQGDEKDSTVGSILIKRFTNYWNVQVVGEYIRRAACHTYKRDSTLNLADQIQVLVRFLFTEFLVYMIQIMSRNKGLNLFFSKKNPSAIPLFKELLRYINVPTLPDLEGSKYHNIVQEDKRNKEFSKPCKFPLFNYTFHSIKRIVEACREHVMIDKSETTIQDIQKEICDKAVNHWKTIIADMVRNFSSII